jgi:dolichyl-phosphate-mannose-protein mannosyltransferase
MAREMVEEAVARAVLSRTRESWTSALLYRALLWSLLGALCLAIIHVSALANGYYQIYYGRFGWGLPEVAFLLHYVLFGTFAMVCLALALSLSVGDSLASGFDRLGALTRGARVALVGASAGVTFGAITLVRYGLLRDTPITDDENTYEFMARVFASGKLYLTSLPTEIRPFFDNQFIVNDGKWYGMYFPGHPLVLALGERVGAGHWVPSVVTVLSVLMGYLVSRRIFGPRAAAIAALLCPVCVYLVLPSATLLSHSTAALTLLVFVYAAIRIEESPDLMRWWGVAGVALAWAGVTRPLAPAVFALPWVFGLILRLRGSGARAWGGGALFVSIGLVGVGMLFGYNYALTGSPLETPYQRFRELTGHVYLAGKLPAPWPLPTIYEIGHTILRLNFWEFGWPLSLLFVPFFRRTSLSIRLLLSACAVPAAYALIGMTNVYALGPTHYSEVAILVCILSASGIEELVARARAYPSGERWAHFVMAVPVAGATCMLLVFMPIHGASLRQMSELTRAPYDLVEENGLDRAIVLVESLPALRVPPGAWVYFHRNPRPDLSDRTLFVQYLGPTSEDRLGRFFPDRRLYVMGMQDGRLVVTAVRP